LPALQGTPPVPAPDTAQATARRSASRWQPRGPGVRG